MSTWNEMRSQRATRVGREELRELVLEARTMYLSGMTLRQIGEALEVDSGRLHNWIYNKTFQPDNIPQG